MTLTAISPQANHVSDSPSAQFVSLLNWIRKMNEAIEDSKSISNADERDLMVSQFEHMKMKFTRELFELLEDYRLPIEYRLVG